MARPPPGVSTHGMHLLINDHQLPTVIIRILPGSPEVQEVHPALRLRWAARVPPHGIHPAHILTPGKFGKFGKFNPARSPPTAGPVTTRSAFSPHLA
jgi:hypothetical protein